MLACLSGFLLSVPLFVLLGFVTHKSVLQIAILCILLVCISFSAELVMVAIMAEMTYTL